MAKFPEPPAAAALPAPELKSLARGTRVWRIFFRGGPHPTFWDTFRSFGPTGSRFDHHEPPPRVQPRSILYGALSGPTCLAEVFQQTRVVDRQANHPWLVGFDLADDVQLLDLTGTWPTKAGASMAISTGPRPRAQRWSRAFYKAFPQIGGVFYPSSMHANLPALAFYERALPAMPGVPAFHRSLTDPALLGPLRHAAANLGYGLV